MGRKPLTEQRRLEICEAYQDCLIKKGSYSDTSLKDVGEALGCAPSILLHYFKSKEEIHLETSRKVNGARYSTFISILTEQDADKRREKIVFLLNDQRNTRFLRVMGIRGSKAYLDLFLEQRAAYYEELKRLLPEASDFSLNAITFLFKSIVHHYTAFSGLYDFGDYVVDLIMREIDRLFSSDHI